MDSIEDQLPTCMTDLCVTTADDDTVTISSRFAYPITFPGFIGHFEGNPVLPAIVQLSSVRYALEHHCGNKLLLSTVQRAKFRSMVQPDQPISINLKVTLDADLYQTRFKITDSEGKMISDGICRYTVKQ